ncbi:MAG: ribonuclease R [Verrucomicrobia bacterium]|nr:ribonuclease R [Verrucomicrobiota bacterium]
MEEQILELLGRRDYAPLKAVELGRSLAVPAGEQRAFHKTLQALERTGRITLTKAGRYVRSLEADLIPGRIQITRQGRGYLQPDDPGLKELLIPENATSTALHEDRVLVRRDVKPRGLRGEGREENTGAVIRILERRRSRIVGTLQQSRQFLYVIPDDPRIPHDVYVPPARDVGRPARVGDKVVVELREWQSRHTNPEGEIIEVLGASDAEGVDMLSVLRHYDLPLHFPKAALQEARAVGDRVAPEEIQGRTDCRSQQVITIDPDDAKDFDDAIFLERADADQWRLWVHIADVSHYVKPGTALDKEARRRGNSTYLVDRVIPMLPEALSNELCSLKPEVERLTKSVEFLISSDGAVLRTRFHSSVIHSRRRYTYGEAFAILQRPPASALERMLHETHQLAQKIRRRRFKQGALALDFPERKIRLDEQGRVARIEKVENDVSHQLIEEFMLLANEAVAVQLVNRRRPAIHRVHEEPDLQRLQEYREEVLSHNVPCGDLRQRAEVQKLLERLDQLPIGPALKIGFLKSLMRARYATEPIGHYGLAKTRYAHFTSPIRRYADLVVHRALFEQTAGSAKALGETASHLSITERNSADAERDSKDVKLFAFLRAQMDSGRPEAYAALVTDVRNFGFFVDVPELTMSGLVHLSSVTDDFYQFDSSRTQLVGRRTRRVIRLGDNLTVQVARIDAFKKQVDFQLVKGAQAQAPAARAARGRTPLPSTRSNRAPGQTRPQSPRRPQRAHRSSGPRRSQERQTPPGQRARRPQRRGNPGRGNVAPSTASRPA